MAKILILTGDAAESLEVLYPYQRLREEGYQVAAYPALAPDLRAAGARFVDAEAVVDGMMVSARAWPDDRPGCGSSSASCARTRRRASQRTGRRPRRRRERAAR